MSRTQTNKYLLFDGTTNKYLWKRLLIRISLIIIIALITIAGVFYFQNTHSETADEKERRIIKHHSETADEKERRIIKHLNITLDNDRWFPRGDNITGWSMDVVPNIVHYILFETHTISYIHMLSMFSVLRIQEPDQIIIHCDCDRIDDGDANWARILNFVNITNDIAIHINKIKKPTDIFGQKLKYGNFHASDVTRYRTLRKYGGIYLDNDVFVVQPLDEFFKFEFTVNWDVNQSLGAQVLIGNRDARFLKFALHTYTAYDGTQWYYNAGHLPTRAILYKYLFLAHRVKILFGVDAAVACPYFYTEYHADWQNKYYTFHMVARGNTITWKDWCLSSRSHFMWNAVINDALIKTLNTTFGEMSRYVLFGKKNLNETNTKNSSPA